MADKESEKGPQAEKKPGDPALFVNRELSWLEFNRRVLGEAEDPETPALERLKFLSIFSSNLDEFYMVRIGAHARLLHAGVEESGAAGMGPKEQIEAVAAKARPFVAEQYKCLSETVLPILRQAGVEICPIESLDKQETAALDAYFESQVFPILSPLAVDAGHPFPFLGNLKLNLMVLFKEMDSVSGLQPFAFVEVPSVIPRLIRVRESEPGYRFVLLENLVSANIGSLFPGMKIARIVPFRVTRNQDYNLHEEVVLDLLKSVEAEIKDRSDKIAVRLEIAENPPKKALTTLLSHLSINPENVFQIPGPINLCGLLPLCDLPLGPAHKDPPFNPRMPKRLADAKDIFGIIRDGDVLLHHPYDSFAVVVDFINSSAEDPDVLAIKQTLYRVDRNSPIVEALCRAAENGKQVTAVVELKARFDEEKNIDFANQMEKAGINPVYGFVRWKTHCKATLVVRREGKELRRYSHLSSGNYNSVTAKIYTDLGLLTADPVMGNDVAALFNVLTGFNSWTGGDMFTPEAIESRFKKLFIAPVNIQSKIVDLIEREIKNATPKNPGRIIAKLNAIIDEKVIRTLYKASQAGVHIDLVCRGICCLKPGVPGLSENIRVISILDRFLEHSRILYFHNGGDPEIYSGSADWMPRNFRRRAEILYPIEDRGLKTRIIDEILMTYLSDNVKARVMQPDGSYRRLRPKEDEAPVRSQSQLIAIARKGGVKSPPYEDLVKQISKRLRKRK